MGMTEHELDVTVAAHVAGGYTVVQEGPVLKPPQRGVSFNKRVAGFDILLLGSYGPPDWRSSFDNLLFDTDTRWVHLRKQRRQACGPAGRHVR